MQQFVCMIRMEGSAAQVLFLPFELRFPDILPKRHPITQVLLEYYQQQAIHANAKAVINEVRQRFRIPNFRAELITEGGDEALRVVQDEEVLTEDDSASLGAYYYRLVAVQLYWCGVLGSSDGYGWKYVAKAVLLYLFDDDSDKPGSSHQLDNASVLDGDSAFLVEIVLVGCPSPKNLVEIDGRGRPVEIIPDERNGFAGCE